MVTHRYLWGPGVDQLLADEAISTPGCSGETRWALGDQLGSVRDVVTYDSGTDTVESLAHRTYDSFGNLTSEQNENAVDILFGYTGRQFDEATGLQNNLNRWYDPAVGRWISEDPIGFAGGDANLGRYVANSPIHSIDWTGLNTGLVNRPLNSDRPTDPANPVSHTFIVVTSPNGTFHTYSWGNDYDENNNGVWVEDHPNDMSAAFWAIQDNQVTWYGGNDLDPYIKPTFEFFEHHPDKTGHWWLWNNCKHRAQELLEVAMSWYSMDTGITTAHF